MDQKFMDKVSGIDPDNLTVETVKMLFPWTPRWFAKLILATGVRRGEFEKMPNGTIRLSKSGPLRLESE